MLIVKYIKEKIKESPILWRSYTFMYCRFLGKNRINNKGKQNKIEYSNSILENTRINIYGSNNIISIGNNCRITDLVINIYGENNLINIGENCVVKKSILWIENNQNCLSINKDTTIEKNTEIACIEGCKVIIGKDCMLSSDIIIRTGDSHSIMNLEKKRINPSKDVKIGNHVWIGNRVAINKGVNIAKNSIIGTGAIVTQSFEKENIIIAGNPASIIKENIDW